MRKLIPLIVIVLAGFSIVINYWFGLGIILGFIWRSYSGNIISITTGLAIGILINEFIRYFTR